ncbi:MAG: MBL fold metallo-hydrolase [Parcubacteria group bacterium]|nr:MBL fold metallo-hydrolase [Parcubacteria group bacterium]
MFNLYNKVIKVIICILILINGLVFSLSLSLKDNDELKIYFFDIGQGDSIFVETPSRKQILIDSGPSTRVVQKLGKVMPFFDHSIDTLILTHTDKDHIGGMPEVLNRFKVRSILDTGIICITSICDEYNKAVGNELSHGAVRVLTHTGQRWDFGDGVFLTILSPFEKLDQVEVSKPNETSVVVRLDYAGRSVLFTGDIGGQTEEKLVLADIKLKSDILKVPHHGSKYSSSDIFLKSIDPDYAVISVAAKNSYGHPTKEALERLANSGATLYRTDEDGDILLHINSKGKLWLEKNKI